MILQLLSVTAREFTCYVNANDPFTLAKLMKTDTTMETSQPFVKLYYTIMSL